MPRCPIILALAVAGAAAGAESRFGTRGQVVPFGGLSFRHTSQNGTDTNSVSLEPGALLFATDSIAVGASVLYGYTKGVPLAGQTAVLVQGFHSLGFTPMIGVSIPLVERVVLFPTFGVRFQWNLPDSGSSLNLITLRAFAPVAFIPVTHFFIGFGPEFSADVASSAGKEFGIGLATRIGGYF